MKMSDIKALLKAGKIRGYKAHEAPKRDDLPPALGNGHVRNPGHKERLDAALVELCRERGLPLFREQRFHAMRKWRLDFLIPGRQPIAIEYEGLGYGKTGHTESHRYTDNTDKYNAAQMAGILVLRYTFSNWQQCCDDVKMFFL